VSITPEAASTPEARRTLDAINSGDHTHNPPRVDEPPESSAAEVVVESAAVAEARHLLTEWEDRAETTLIRSDYQRGQRDATLACIADLRERLGGR